MPKHKLQKHVVLFLICLFTTSFDISILRKMKLLKSLELYFPPSENPFQFIFLLHVLFEEHRNSMWKQIFNKNAKNIIVCKQSFPIEWLHCVVTYSSFWCVRQTIIEFGYKFYGFRAFSVVQCWILKGCLTFRRWKVKYFSNEGREFHTLSMCWGHRCSALELTLTQKHK